MLLARDPVEGMPKVDVNIGLNELQFEKKISKGSFGEVWKASYLGTDVAVKKMLKPDDAFVMRLIQRELTALQEIRHPNICLFIGLCLDNSEIQVVTEFIDGGTLWKLLKHRKNPINWHTRLHFAVELAKAITFIHAKNIMHRDLKSENILIDKNNHLKVCDFGLCRGEMTDTSSKFMTKAGTETWMAPEIIIGSAYSLKADIFSFGVVLYEIIVRDRPPDRSPMNAYNFDMEEFASAFPPECPKELADLTKACVAADCDARPAMMEILNTLKEIKSKLPPKEGSSSKRESKMLVSSPLPPPMAASAAPLVVNTLTSNLIPPPPSSSAPPVASPTTPVLPPPMNLAAPASTPAAVAGAGAGAGLNLPPASPGGLDATGGEGPSTKKKKKKKIEAKEGESLVPLPFELPPPQAMLASAPTPILEAVTLPSPVVTSPVVLPDPIVSTSLERPQAKSTPNSPRRPADPPPSWALTAFLPPPIAPSASPLPPPPAVAPIITPLPERSSSPSRRKLEVNFEERDPSAEPTSKARRKSAKSIRSKDPDRLRASGAIGTSALPGLVVAKNELPPPALSLEEGLPPPLIPPSDEEEESSKKHGDELTGEKRTIRHRKSKSRDETLPSKMKKRRSGE